LPGLVIPLPRLMVSSMSTALFDSPPPHYDPYRLVLTASLGHPRGTFAELTDGITHFTLRGDGSQTAILATGIGDAMGYYDALEELLVRRGVRVLRYEYYGRGWSLPFHAVQHNAEAYMAQACQLVSAVGLESVPLTWIGHSMGGLVGVLCTHHRRLPIESLVLLSPAFFASKPALANLADRLTCLIKLFLWGLPSVVRQAFLGGIEAGFFHEANGSLLYPDAYQANFQRSANLAAAYPHILHAVARTSADLLRADKLPGWRRFFARITIPVTVIWPEGDRVVPFKHAETLSEWGPTHASLRTLPRLGHQALDEQPEEIARAVCDILRLLGDP